jgi:hypothetical protein
MPVRQNSEARQLARDLATLAYDLASERMNMVFRRYGVETKKYNPAQPRVPAKQHGAGQWTKAPSSGTSSAVRAGARALGTRALGILAANPEAAPAAGAALLPGMIGGVGISRAAGLNAVVGGGGASHGMGMTPILGLPFKLAPPPTSGPLTPEEQTEKGRIEEECLEQYDKDEITCKMNSAIYAKKTMYSSGQIFNTCMAQALLRFNQCKDDGGTSKITIPLFDGRKIK